MPQPASMCSQSRVRDRAQSVQPDTNLEVEMAANQTAERQDLASITEQIAALQEMTGAELRERYLEVIGRPSRSNNRQYLVKRIAWQIQANAEGGLSQRALDRIEQLAPHAPVRWRQPLGQVEVETKVDTGLSPVSGRDPRLPAPGTVISRTYKGEEHQVVVHEADFEYQGRRFKSLSKVAKEITGTNWNGYGFFKLGGAA